MNFSTENISENSQLEDQEENGSCSGVGRNVSNESERT
jgi:hypothetical protein